MELEFPFRYAIPDDAPVAVDLANLTIEGFAAHLWEDLAGEGESPRDFGLRVQQDFIAERRTIVADIKGQIAALMISFKIEPKPKSFMPGMNAGLQPILELHAMVPDSWYIHSVITIPKHRGSGLGSRMMHLAEETGKASDCGNSSLLVLNTNAIRLYENLGYETLSSKPIVKDGWVNPASDWLLMVKNLA